MNRFYIWLLAGVMVTLGPRELRAGPMEEAQQLIHDRQFDTALAKFAAMPRAESDQVLILRLEGVCYIKLKRYPEAEKTLRQATQADPANIASRFYLAQALASEGNVDESVPLLESVQKEAPDSEYGALSVKILPALRNLLAATQKNALPPDSYSQYGNSVIYQQPTKRWAFTLNVGAAYDDNVNQAARAANNQAALSGFSFVTSDEASVAFLDEKLDDAPLTIRGTYDFYQNVHDTSATSNFDITTHDVAVSFEKTTNVFGYPTRFYAAGGYRNESEGGSKFDDSFTGSASIATTWNNWLSTTIYDSYGQYNYSGGNYYPSLFSRTGGVNRIGFYPIFTLFNGKWKIQPVYEFNSYDVQGIEFGATSGNTVGVTSRLDLPGGFTLINGFQWQNEYYSEFAPSPKRYDNIYDVSASISHQIFIPELTGNVSEFYETTDSTQPFANYTRNVISIGVTYTY
jgi:hypothetical protein